MTEPYTVYISITPIFEKSKLNLSDVKEIIENMENFEIEKGEWNEEMKFNIYIIKFKDKKNIVHKLEIINDPKREECSFRAKKGDNETLIINLLEFRTNTKIWDKHSLSAVYQLEELKST